MTRNEDWLKRYQEGTPLATLAQEAGVSPQAVWNAVKVQAAKDGLILRRRHGEPAPVAIPDDLKAAYARGEVSQREVARRLDLPLGRVHRALTGTPHTTRGQKARALREKVYQDFLTGDHGRPMPARLVAQKHGLAVGTVENMVRAERQRREKKSSPTHPGETP